MGPLCPCPNSKKAYEKGTRGISWGPLLTLGPRAVPKFSKWSVCPWQTHIGSVQESDHGCNALQAPNLKNNYKCTYFYLQNYANLFF
ncbi:unnamed protein product, partial [Staurois parvus]